ncbi:MAG: hypothetical protein ACLR0I_04815 [Streptococcus salivarius]
MVWLVLGLEVLVLARISPECQKLDSPRCNVSDDLARLSGKVEDAFAYADGAVSKNIGKHNASHQSNGGNWMK